jgi:hypothetical protein
MSKQVIIKKCTECPFFRFRLPDPCTHKNKKKQELDHLDLVRLTLDEAILKGCPFDDYDANGGAK